MSLQENHEETYKRIKKRIEEYRYRSGLLTIGAMIFALLFIFSLFPLVPVVVASFLGIVYTNWVVPLWFLCIGIFGALFWCCQKSAKKIEEKRGITLEEWMYVFAYEALCYLREYLDPNHRIIGSKLKAERRVLDIVTLLAGVGFPNASLIREEAVQIGQLWKNLKTRLLSSMKKYLSGNDSKIIGNVHSSLIALLDYLSKPELPSLLALNNSMTSLPEITERSIYDDFRSTVIRRSNLRHTMAFSVVGVAAMLITYADINYFGASQPDAFALGVGSLIALATLYVTYLGLTVRREPRT